MPSNDPERRREVYRVWYWRHRVEKIAQSKEYYDKNRESILKREREQYQQWYLKHKDDPEYKKRKRAWLRKYRARLKRRLRLIFGNKCYICTILEKVGKKVGCYPSLKPKLHRRSLVFHEINGAAHPRTPLYYINHQDSVVQVCTPHHRSIHFCTDTLGLKWKDIIARLNG